ncbi:MAG: tetratricopeptide repeat protein [Polynucleobacter sp.]|jgi:predicted O-linked N-acetylglucosamine transferase (SPINDLY family)|nr:tetratricopeptide repeat protein [Polynucleobacter sp.]
MIQSKIKNLLVLAEQNFRNKNFNFSENLLNQVVLLNPQNSKANELLAYIHGNRGNTDAALRYLNLACSQKNCSPGALYHLGVCLFEKESYVDAINALNNSIAKGGEYFEALFFLGTAYSNLGEFEKALLIYRKCLKQKDNSAELFYNLAKVLEELDSPSEAIEHYSQALSLNPNYLEAYLNKGSILVELKKFDEALLQFNTALNIKPDSAEAWFGQGNSLFFLRHFERANISFEKAIQYSPKSAKYWSNKGKALSFLKRHNEAIDHYDKALTFNPALAEIWVNKSIALQALRDFDCALICYQNALKINPELEFACGDFIFLKMKMCDWSDFKYLKNNIENQIILDNRDVMATSGPFPLLALSESPAIHKRAAEIYALSQFPENLDLGPLIKNPINKKIRVGYFSADFKNHAVAILIAGLFESHDKSKFELFAFSFINVNDEMRGRLLKSFDYFIDVETETDLEIAKLARISHIDIAIDLSGFTFGSRTGIFSYRAAPIQINYLGYPGTLGSKYFDYIIADKVVIPFESNKFYSESIIYLPNSYQANDRLRVISDKKFSRIDLNLPQNSFIYCCFNNSYKILPATFASWMRILNSVENSVLWLLQDNLSAKNNLLMEAEKYEIDPCRIIFAERMSPSDHLARHHLADLFLDTFPYNAHTTASDALWAGLPVLTRTGESFPSRVAASLLCSIGLPELVTDTIEKYEALAIELGQNPGQLNTLKKKLANNRLSTPLFDTAQFTKNIECAYFKVYENYQKGLDMTDIYP